MRGILLSRNDWLVNLQLIIMSSYYALLLLIPLFVRDINQHTGNTHHKRVVGANDGWVNLYNGKDLTGWDSYIGPPLDDSGKMQSQTPVGLNKDPHRVFSTVQQDGETLIRISGENWGAISTKQEYANYHLQLQFKWGLAKWGQKRKDRKSVV